MPELVFLKLGGSIITDKQRPFTARLTVIARLGQEIKAALAGQPGLRLIVGHGSGSFGHAVAQKYRTHQGNIDADSWLGFARTADAAAHLNRVVSEALLEQGVPLVSFQPSASARCQQGKLMSLELGPVQSVLAAGLVPVVYGDVAIDQAQGFTIVSTEQILSYLAHHLQPSRIVLAGMVDGVYSADPMAYPEAVRYPTITPASWPAIQDMLGGSYATDVTGGMLSKVRTMLELVSAQPTLKVQIVSGALPGRVAGALSGSLAEAGTLIRYI
jgi:isopentenyl phosphate kinase